jgi:hypothetical protein
MHWSPHKILWLTPATLSLFTALAMRWWRLTWREYPWFFLYLIAEVVRTAALFSIGNDSAHYATYFYTYWASEAFVSVLGFFVIGEVFQNAFSDRLGLQRWRSSIFRYALLSLIVIAVLLSATSHGNDSSRLMAGVLVLKRTECFVRLGLIAALFIFISVLGLSWTSHTIGITFGLALYGLVEAVGIAARFHFGPSVNRAVILSVMVAACCQSLIWAVYFMRAPAATQTQTPELITQGLQDFADNQEAIRILLGKKW